MRLRIFDPIVNLGTTRDKPGVVNRRSLCIRSTERANVDHACVGGPDKRPALYAIALQTRVSDHLLSGVNPIGSAKSHTFQNTQVYEPFALNKEGSMAHQNRLFRKEEVTCYNTGRIDSESAAAKTADIFHPIDLAIMIKQECGMFFTSRCCSCDLSQTIHCRRLTSLHPLNN